MRSVTKVFVETSVFIRFLTRDVEEKYQDCLEFFRLIESGKIRPYISNIVIMEIVFILTRHYGFKKDRVLSAVTKILSLRNITLREETVTTQALELFDKHTIKYGECMITTQVAEDMILVTYDSDFKKIAGINSCEPREMITHD